MLNSPSVSHALFSHQIITSTIHPWNEGITGAHGLVGIGADENSDGECIQTPWHKHRMGTHDEAFAGKARLTEAELDWNLATIPRLTLWCL